MLPEGLLEAGWVSFVALHARGREEPMKVGDQVFSCAIAPWNNGNQLIGRFLWRDRAWPTVAPRHRSSARVSEKEISAERFSADLCVAAAARP
jgi:hypothetical protein